jgi:hypothetical protein
MPNNPFNPIAAKTRLRVNGTLGPQEERSMSRVKVGFPALISLLISASATAGEFRSLKFGETCDGVVEKERTLGSRISLDTSQPTISAEYLGRDAIVGYICDSSNQLTDGVYQYEFASYQQAEQFFEQSRSLLILELGIPRQDSTTPEMKAAGRKLGSDSDLGESVLWIDGDRLVNLGLELKAPSSEAIVIVSFRPRRRAE